jgi:hypothetical protein
VDIVRSVADLIRSYGFDVHQPVSLRSTNNVVVWLSPSPVVAKLSEHHVTARRELAIAGQLVELAAPVIHPFQLGVEQPVIIDKRTVTFWSYEPQDLIDELGSGLIADCLYRLHASLSLIRARERLPSFAESLVAAVRSLEQSDFAAELAEPDRTLLRGTLVDGITRLEQIAGSERVIHGSPHRLNILSVDGAPTFIDFETVAIGPPEWDLAHLEPEVADLYPGDLDRVTLDLCRVLVSAATSTWCWQALDRGPDMRRHAQHHLGVVRSTRS